MQPGHYILKLYLFACVVVFATNLQLFAGKTCFASLDM